MLHQPRYETLPPSGAIFVVQTLAGWIGSVAHAPLRLASHFRLFRKWTFYWTSALLDRAVVHRTFIRAGLDLQSATTTIS
jgi:hypothetical protein